jgi:hypothetical protein
VKEESERVLHQSEERERVLQQVEETALPKSEDRVLQQSEERALQQSEERASQQSEERAFQQSEERALHQSEERALQQSEESLSASSALSSMGRSLTLAVRRTKGKLRQVGGRVIPGLSPQPPPSILVSPNARPQCACRLTREEDEDSDIFARRVRLNLQTEVTYYDDEDSYERAAAELADLDEEEAKGLKDSAHPSFSASSYSWFMGSVSNLFPSRGSIASRDSDQESDPQDKADKCEKNEKGEKKEKSEGKEGDSWHLPTIKEISGWFSGSINSQSYLTAGENTTSTSGGSPMFVDGIDEFRPARVDCDRPATARDGSVPLAQPLPASTVVSLRAVTARDGGVVPKVTIAPDTNNTTLRPILRQPVPPSSSSVAQEQRNPEVSTSSAVFNAAFNTEQRLRLASNVLEKSVPTDLGSTDVMWSQVSSPSGVNPHRLWMDEGSNISSRTATAVDISPIQEDSTEEEDPHSSFVRPCPSPKEPKQTTQNNT